MSLIERYKFIKEFTLSQPKQESLNQQWNQILRENFSEKSYFGNLKYCHFSQIKELTQNEQERPFKDSSDHYGIPKRDQRCYFNGQDVKVVSRGGSDFALLNLLNTLDVFPIEDGLIVKLNHQRELLVNEPLFNFDPSNPQNFFSHNPADQTYSYVTVSGHPLNDMHPLRIRNQGELINTKMEVIYVGYKLPLVVLYNPQNFQVIFGILCYKQAFSEMEEEEDDSDQERQGDQTPGQNPGYSEFNTYVRGIDRESRHKEIYNISKQAKISIEEIYSFQSPIAPTLVHFSQGLYNKEEIVLYLFYKEKQTLEFFTCPSIRNIRDWKNTTTLNSIQDISLIRFSRGKEDSKNSIKLINSDSKAKIQGNTQPSQGCKENYKILKKRLALHTKDLLIYDNNSRQLLIYSGSLLIHFIDLAPSHQNSDTILAQNFGLITPEDRQTIGQSQLFALKESNNHNVSLQFSNGFEKRVSFRLNLSDFILQSVLKVLRKLYDQKVFENLYQDFIEAVIKAGQEAQKLCNQANAQSILNSLSNQSEPLYVLSQILIRILTGSQGDQPTPVTSHQQMGNSFTGSFTSSQTNSFISGSQNALSNQVSGTQANSKPNATLNTKILRSSTTNFGDSILTRRKFAQITAQQQAAQMSSGNQHQTATPAQTRIPASRITQVSGPGVQTRSQMPLNTTKLGLSRRPTAGAGVGDQASILQLASNTQHNFATTSSTFGSQNVPSISQNPFQDLLASDFHKQNFSSQFAGLFPANMELRAPNPIANILPRQADEKPTQVSISPTKSSNTASRPSTTTKVSSTKQSNAFQPAYERRSSNLQTTQVSHNNSSNQNPFSPASNSIQQQPQIQPVTIQVFLSGSNYRTSQQDLLPKIEQLAFCLHLLHEDLKLNNLRAGKASLNQNHQRSQLALLLIRLNLLINPYKRSAFVQHYVKDLENWEATGLESLRDEIQKHYKDGPLLKQGLQIEPVPKILTWIANQLKQEQGLLDFDFPLLFETTRKVARVYEILGKCETKTYLYELPSTKRNQNQSFEEIFKNEQVIKACIFKDGLQGNVKKNVAWKQHIQNDYTFNQQLQSLHPYEKVLFCLMDETMSMDDLKKLPSIVALPILEIIRYAKLFQQEVQTAPVWPDSLFKLIQREDILNNHRLFERQPTSKIGEPSDFERQMLNKMTKQTSMNYALNRGLTNVFRESNTLEDDIQEEHRQATQENINSTIEQNFRLASATGLQYDIFSKNSHLNEYFQNRFSGDTRLQEVTNLLDSSKHMRMKLEQLQDIDNLMQRDDAFLVEKQKLLDKLFLRHLSKCCGRGALNFGTSQTLQTEALVIPKISTTSFAPMNESYMQVEFKEDNIQKEMMSWPEFHNGVASVLRIATSLRRNLPDGKGNPGHMSDLNNQQMRNWIMFHKPTLEPKCEHGGFLLAIGLLGQLDVLAPTDIYTNLKSIHEHTVIGMLLGRAASKIGSMDSHDTRYQCIHIPYLLPPSMSVEIALPIQAAALVSAGLLYKGTANRLMNEMVYKQIGCKPFSDKFIEREGYALAAGIALGFVNLGIGRLENKAQLKVLQDLDLETRLIRYIEGGKIIDLPERMLINQEQRQGQACSSIKEGDMVNVHVTSSGALIALTLMYLKSNNQALSDQITLPTTLYSMESVRPAFLLLKTLARNLINWDSIKADEEWVKQQVPELIRKIFEQDFDAVQKKFKEHSFKEPFIDFSTAALSYVNIVAGSIFSIGFKYVGTGDKQAFSLVNKYTQHFFRQLKVMSNKQEYIGVVHNQVSKNSVDKHTVDTCLCICAFAMSMIMAGTGDEDCFRSLRVLRKRFEHEINYGYNMAINMSLGFLFLGSGAFTFSNDDLSIASLLCSLYPIFPQNPNDNRHHLQALRHFYVMAIESRIIQARDIDTGEFVQVNMEITSLSDNNQNDYQAIKQLIISTPEIVPTQIKKIHIKSELYHDVLIEAPEGQFLNFNRLSAAQLKKYEWQVSLGRSQRNFEKINQKRIIYLKKKTIVPHCQKAIAAINDEINLQFSSEGLLETVLLDLISAKDPSARILLDQVSLLNGKLSSVNDPSISAFQDHFINIKELKQKDFFCELENVLLAQLQKKNQLTRLDVSSGSLSVSDFFQMQDTKEIILDSYLRKDLPSYAMVRLQILKILGHCFLKGQLEHVNSMFDSQIIKGLSQGESSLLQSYLTYRNSSLISSKEDIMPNLIDGNQTSTSYEGQISFNVENEINLLSQKIQNVNLFQKLISPSKAVTAPSNSKPECHSVLLDQLDLYQISICHQIANQILYDLVSTGEEDYAKHYRQRKVNGQPVEESVLQEINETIKLSILAVLGDAVIAQTLNSNDNPSYNDENAKEGIKMIHIIDSVIIPAVLRF